MPIYDYQCQSCNFKSEVMRKVSAPNVEVCPQCGAEAFSKQLSAPSFQLNGSGWYATDFKNSGSKPSNTATSQAAESSTEAKPEAKSGAGGCQAGCACH
jgi:putative FmdB family regulatory protein